MPVRVFQIPRFPSGPGPARRSPSGLNARPDTPDCDASIGSPAAGLEREPDLPGGEIPEPDTTAPVHRGKGPPVGAEGDLPDLTVMTAERRSILMGKPVQIVPLPPAEVGFVLARFHQIEQEAEPEEIVGFPGGQREVRAGRVQGRAQLFPGAPQPCIGRLGIACQARPRCRRPRERPRGRLPRA